MSIESWFYTRSCITVLLAISARTAFTAVVHFRRLRNTESRSEPLRAYVISACACVLFVSFAVYKNIPIVMDKARIALVAQDLGLQLKEERGDYEVPFMGILTASTGFPILWHNTTFSTVSMKVESVIVSPLRIGFNLFILAASLFALISLLKGARKVSLSTLLLTQLTIAILVHLYLKVQPSYLGPVFICMIILPQLIYLARSVIGWTRRHGVQQITRQVVLGTDLASCHE